MKFNTRMIDVIYSMAYYMVYNMIPDIYDIYYPYDIYYLYDKWVFPMSFGIFYIACPISGYPSMCPSPKGP